MFQQLVIVGNLGRDPDLRFTPSGTPVCSLSVATNRKYTGKDGEQVKETTWFRVSVFGKQAEACAQYLHKGSAVLVEGRLTPDANTGGPRVYDRKDGTSGASFEVFAQTVRFLGGGNGGSNADAEADAETEDHEPEPAPADDIPF
jgi:single-strand DNA-binding protein